MKKENTKRFVNLVKVRGGVGGQLLANFFLLGDLGNYPPPKPMDKCSNTSSGQLSNFVLTVRNKDSVV